MKLAIFSILEGGRSLGSKRGSRVFLRLGRRVQKEAGLMGLIFFWSAAERLSERSVRSGVRVIFQLVPSKMDQFIGAGSLRHVIVLGLKIEATVRVETSLVRFVRDVCESVIVASCGWLSSGGGGSFPRLALITDAFELSFSEGGNTGVVSR